MKFKAGSAASIKAPKASKFRTARVAEVDRVFSRLGVTEVEELMPLTGREVHAKAAKAFNGKPVAAAPMAKAYRVALGKSVSVHDAVEALSALEDVEFAEPNYLVYSLASTSEPDDPYYSLQYGIKDINLPELWGKPVISKEGPVIAILDTGVDIEHPDLAANIWTNPAEVSGASGYDDDGNGFIDDLHGWDFVNETGRIGDYNGHGTHCAGIAAACGGNGIGITGANPYARIMPLTVLQSTGTGDVATIIKAVDYAAANGASIISMSLGSYASSQALEQALGRAYQKAMIVAAAGNDGYCLNHAHPEKAQQYPMPMFPAAYSFVLGVQASAPDGGLAQFSNYDDNGPNFSETGEDKLYNYEVTAPGVSIMSTYPGGKYKQLNGTSMATPLVAGALSRLLQAKEYTSKEELFGDLIYSVTPKGNVDFAAAYNIKESDRKPTLSLVSYRVDDAKSGDGDGRPDAGETVYIYPTFRNLWGNAKNIFYALSLSDLEDPEMVEIIDGGFDRTISKLSSYASVEAENPLVVKINPNCVDGRQINLKMTLIWQDSEGNLYSKLPLDEIILTIVNGVEIGGVIKSDLTLTSDKNYIVTNTLAVPAGVTLTIEPGTVLKFKQDAGIVVTKGEAYSEPFIDGGNQCSWAMRRNDGKVIAKGEPGKMIVFTAEDRAERSMRQTFNFGYNSELDYCRFTGFLSQYLETTLTEAFYADTFVETQWLPNQIKEFIGKGFAHNCVIDNISCYQWDTGLSRRQFLKQNLASRFCDYRDIQVYGTMAVLKSSESNYTNIVATEGTIVAYEAESLTGRSNVFSNYCKGFTMSFSPYVRDPKVLRPTLPMYYGTANNGKAKDGILDIDKGFEYASYDVSNMLTRPVATAHGIVWKVVVNGFDAQDEYDMLPPLGVGRHKFEVYFNRKMDHSTTPMLAMGVRMPYTQTAIAEDGSWRTETFDGDEVDIYTAYLTINGRSNYDGVNRLYVAGALDDEFFEIPTENVRFNVNVQAAGSLSEGFTAEAGLGRVNLRWENPEEDFDDMLGYNMYRYSVDAQGAPSDTIRVNPRLLEATDTELTDYDVTPGTTYCYFYRVMRTSMTENDPSKTVAVTPMTSVAGDANGSGDVDVADVITAVNYAAGMDPKPFIFEAADMNADSEIDILDVVGIIRAILNPGAAATASATAQATYFVDGGVVYIDTPVALAGVQLNLNLDRDATVAAAETLAGFEQTGAWIGDNEYIFMAYTMKGLTVPAGIHPILAIGEGGSVKSVRLSDQAGANVEAVYSDNLSGVESVGVSAQPEANGVYNIMGVKVAEGAEALDRLPAGVYVVNGRKILK